MKIKKYFMIPFLALLASSCQDEEQASIQPATGEEVQFGVALEAGSRTIYGEEANGAFPIYWVNGDQVVISSPDCASSGYPSATYQVSVDNATQNYASSLNKTGEIGVRWGDSETADFYSVYPASHATVGSNYNTVTLTMPAQQDNGYDRNTMKVQPDMNACFMYAVAENVESGSTVNLTYKPLSTAVRFKLTGPASGEVSINYVRIFAPEGTNINGTFSADFANRDGNGCPKMTATRGLNYVTFNVADDKNTYLTLANGANIEVNAFLLLEKETEITDEWRIEIGTSAGISYTKNLDGLATDGKNKTLKPGMVHRLPDLPPLSESPEWDPANWMANLQRNIYLSEISIPGSWYSLNTDYHTRASIQTQYDAGIRAFHLDTRWNATRDWDISGAHWEYTFTDLAIADNGATYNVTGDDGNEGKCMNGSPTFEATLKQITDNAKDDEYMVVMCTFAQGSAVHGDWRQAISDACEKNNKVIMASELTKNTVVGDVLGNVIVIVNTFTEGEVPNSKCMFFNMGITLNESDWTNLSDPNKFYKSPLTWYNTTESGITMYGTHAQITTNGDNSYDGGDRGWVPSFNDRKLMASNILNWSKNNYKDIENYAHDAWIYLGLGGYIPGTGGIFGSDDNPSSVAYDLNRWIGSIVTDMDNTGEYYPIGMVFMNYATDYSNVANNILQLNNKYRKAYDPDRSPIDGSDITRGAVQSAAPGYSSGMADHNTDAIGWTKSR